MAEKKEIKSQFWALQMSIAFHVLVIIFVVWFSSNSSLKISKPIIIDFTLEDAVVPGTGTKEDIKPEAEQRTKKQNQYAKAQGAELDKQQTKTEIEAVKEEPLIPSVNEKDLMPEEQYPLVEQEPVEEQELVVKKKAVLTYIEQDKDSDKNRGQYDIGEHAVTEGDSIKSGFPGERSAFTSNSGQSFGTGTGSSGDAAKHGYIKANFSYIKDMIQRNIAYPHVARRNGWTGMVKVSFIVSSSGNVNDIKVMKSSGFKILDKNAVEAVKSSSPFPEPPVEAQIIVPILYSLH